MAKPKRKKTNPNIARRGVGAAKQATKKAANASAVVKKKTAKNTKAVLGIGKAPKRTRAATQGDLLRKGKSLLRGGSAALARFIAYRYSAKAIARYQDYGLRERRSIRLRRQIVEIDANTFRIKGYIIKTDTAGVVPYSCTCPDFSQFSTDGRYWGFSKAGPFNPCKHMMAVRGRNKGSLAGYWVCNGGICSFDVAAPSGFATRALCEASRFKINGGQCIEAKYNGNVTYTLKQGAFEAPGNNVTYSCASNNIYGPVNGVIYEVSAGFISLYIDCFDDLGIAQRVSVYTIVNTNPVPMIELILTEAIFRRCDGLPECGDGYQCSA